MDRLQGVVQRFRSGSVEREKEPLFLGVPESRSRSYSTNEADKLKNISPKPSRKADMEDQNLALSTTAADQIRQSKNSVESTIPPSDRNSYRKKPSGTFEYTVQEQDTIANIAARFDVTPSELMKINKLISRTVFVGQTLFIPDSKNADSNSSTPRSASPLPNAPGDTNSTGLPSVSNHVPHITPSPDPTKVVMDGVAASLPQRRNSETQKSGREHQQKFLRMPVKRLLEEEGTNASTQGSMVKGTLLVTTNAIMFDPDVCDPLVISAIDQQQFNAVVYMEEVKSVALFHDLTPRMFWRQPKEIRAHSPKPETYHSGQNSKKPNEESLLEKDEESENTDHDRPATDGTDCEEGIKRHRASPNKDNAGDRVQEDEATSNRASEKSVLVEELSQKVPDLVTQHRSSSEMEHSSSSQINKLASPENRHRSRSPRAKVCQRQNAADVTREDLGLSVDKSLSETQSVQPSPSDADLSMPAQSFEPLHFTSKSPKNVISHPQAVHGQTALEVSQLATTVTDVNEDVTTVNAPSSVLNRTEQIILTENKTGSSSEKNGLCDSKENSLTEGEKSPLVRSKSEGLRTDNNDVTSQASEHKEEKAPLRVSKSVSGRSSPWSSKAQSMVDKLALQVSSLSWDTAANQKDGPPKSRDSSPHSSYSALRAPAHHISRLFNYTSNLFQGSAATDKDSPPSPADDKDKSWPSHKLQLKCHFTKEDMSRALGPDPRGYLLRSDSRHFVEPPLYLQIRRGIRKNVEILQPRAFDHWNSGPILNEYWFVVPRVMADKLYSFLMTWQPDAYGDEEETEPRGQFFYDVDDVDSRGKPFIKVTGTGSGEDLLLSEDRFTETEKTWEILSKEEVYGAERKQSMYRQDTFDESNLPELIGPTVIIKPEYLRAILRSLPPSMSVGYNWELVYGTHKHGYSLQNMYMKTEMLEEDAPVLLFIMDTYGVVFGAYLSNTIRQSETFYGTGGTFLFTFQSEFKKFPWRGKNHFFIHGTKDFFAVGGGEGGFGLWLDSDLDKGRSHQCETFMNNVLAKEEDFSIIQLEVWTFVDSCLC